VAAVIEDLTGSSVYVPAEALTALVGAGEAVTGADLQVDATQEAALFDRLVRAPGVQAVIARDRLRESFDATVRESFYIVLTTLVLVAASLAAGTTYNAGRVTLSERARDLASLRVLGFTRGEVARILFGEIGMLGAIGLPLGVLIGIGLAWATVQSIGRDEMFRMPLVIGPRTIALGFVIPVVAGLLSVWPLRHRLDRLDLIESLKTRE
jgi:putative ABC transport system permease protein